MVSSRFFRLPAWLWPVTLVMTCGLILGYYFVRTYLSPLPRNYQLDFGAAKWIQPAQASPIGYFRTKIYLTAAPEQAWLQVAATDNFQLSVNSHDIALEKSLKTRVSGIYDIKGALQPGTNVIGVVVNRFSFPGSAELLVHGAVKQPGRESIAISSNEKWKATSAVGIVEGTEAWNSPAVQDEGWPDAAAAPTVSTTTDWLTTSPLLLQLPATGNWLIARDAPPQAIFSSSFQAGRSGQETWLQVASSGDLDLMINGKLVTTVPTAPLDAKKVPHLNPTTVKQPTTAEQEPSSDASTASAGTTEPLSLEAYDISGWVKRGSNSIVAAVRSNQHPATFLAQGFTLRKDGQIQRLQSDSSWQMVDVPSSNEQSGSTRAIEAGHNGAAPWGYLRQGLVKQPRLTDFDTVAKTCVTILAAILAVIVAWLLAAWAAAILREEPLLVTLRRDALFHVPITLALVFFLMLDYDYRFPRTWSFQPIICFGAIAALAAVRLFHLLDYVKGTRLNRRSWAISRPRLAKAFPYLLLGAIMLLGFLVRYHGLTFISFDQDEMGVIQKSRGVFVRGFPYNYPSTGGIRPATTYELVCYVLAISGRIFGYSEWSMRLPSCIWGTLTIGVIGLMGRRLFNWRTGLASALIYASLTLNIRWSQNAFYCQQCQFFSTLTFWLFYEAIREAPLRRKFMTVASITFCLAYLSWEGSGFILPALVVALFVMYPGNWWWLKGWHLYRCTFCIAVFVISQYCWRTLCGTPPYLTIGSGLSNVAGPSLFFLNFEYQPTYYINELLLGENHMFFTIMACAGLLFCWRQPAFRYLIAVLVTLVFLYTNCLAALSPRYCYFYQPLLLLAGVAVAFAFYDRLLAIVFHEGNSLIGRSFAHAGGVALVLLLFLQSSEWFVRDYYLSAEGDAPGLMTRMNTYKYDYRAAARYVRSHVQPGDLIIPVVPHVFEYYSGMQGNFYLDTLLSKKVSYTTALAEPVFVDKFRGYPVIRNLTELTEATHRGRRTWVVFVPYGSLKKLSSPEVLGYLDKNAKVVFESYRAKVFLIQGANTPANVASSP